MLTVSCVEESEDSPWELAHFPHCVAYGAQTYDKRKHPYPLSNPTSPGLLI